MKQYLHENARPFFMEGGEYAVLLTHGFTGTPASLRPLGEYLHQKGFTVQGILLPGHGTKMEDMRPVSWQQWLEAELTAVRKLKERYRSVSVCGLSMGGVLSLIAAEQMEVTSCVAISAPMNVRVRFTAFARAAALVKPVIYWGNGGEKKAKMPLAEYNIGYEGFPTRSVYDLRQLMLLARKNLYSLSCPLLVVQSRADETISRDSADIIMKYASSTQKEMMWLDDAPHVCTLSYEWENIAGRTAQFLQSAQNG